MHPAFAQFESEARENSAKDRARDEATPRSNPRLEQALKAGSCPERRQWLAEQEIAEDSRIRIQEQLRGLTIENPLDPGGSCSRHRRKHHRRGDARMSGPVDDSIEPYVGRTLGRSDAEGVTSRC